MYKTLSSPLTINIELNSGCNQKCRHCYNFWRETNSPNLSMSLELISKTINELKSCEIFHAVITGGEPLLDVDKVTYLINILSKTNISFSLNSNLTLITKNVASKLRSLGLRSILTSILSYDPKVHNNLTSHKSSLRKTIEGIGIAKESGIKIYVNVVLNAQNIDHTEKTINFIKKLGVNGISLTRVIKPRTSSNLLGWDLDIKPEKLKSVFSQLNPDTENTPISSLIAYPICFLNDGKVRKIFGSIRCSAGKTSATIGSDGLVRACQHHEKTYGSIMELPLREIWRKMSEWRDGSIIPPSCKNCRYLSLCGGGCRMASKNQHIEDEDSLMNIDSIEKITPITKGITVINKKHIFRVRKSCRFREDGDIGIINVSGMKNVFLSPDSFRLFKEFHSEQKTFRLDNLLDLSSDKSESRLIEFLGGLVTSNVLEVLST